MHVFLTGASGYIGSAVADRRRAAGHVVSGLARSDTAASRLSAAGIQPIRGKWWTRPRHRDQRHWCRRQVVIRPAIVYGRGGGIPAEFVDSARKKGGARAGRNSLTRNLGWRPSRPDVITDIEHGSYIKKG